MAGIVARRIAFLTGPVQISPAFHETVGAAGRFGAQLGLQLQGADRAPGVA